MSVIMTMHIKGDPRRLEELVSQDPERIHSISDRSKDHGVIAHRFYGSDDGQILVIDEWPDPQSFQSFFEEQQAQIQPVMEAAGVTSPPEITFWRKLETHDDIGWGA
jgi:hypothetical protein